MGDKVNRAEALMRRYWTAAIDPLASKGPEMRAFTGGGAVWRSSASESATKPVSVPLIARPEGDGSHLDESTSPARALRWHWSNGAGEGEAGADWRQMLPMRFPPCSQAPVAAA